MQQNLEKKESQIQCDKDLQCFKPNGKANPICPKYPCNDCKYYFGKHERIFDYLIENKKWDEVYYYFQDLLSFFNFNCSVDDFERIKRQNPNMKPEEFPAGCRIFIFSRNMKDYRKTIKDTENKYDLNDLSPAGEEELKNAKIKLQKKLYSSLEILKHLAIDKRNQIEDEKFFMSKGVDYLEKMIMAKEKYGIPTNPPDVISQVIEKVIQRGDPRFKEETEKRREFNKERLRKADLLDTKDKLLKAIEERIVKDGNIKPETQKLIDQLKKLNEELGD